MRRRQVPNEWRTVFEKVFGPESYDGNSFGSEMVMKIAISEGLTISKEGLRVKLARYVQKGYLKKIKRGRYGLGPKGYYFFGLLELGQEGDFLSMEGAIQ